MRREHFLMEKESEELISYCLYQKGSDNRPELERMRAILRRAFRHELTERQRACMTLYYLEGMKMKDIARSLCLSKSTVSRHISAATLKLRHIAAYYLRVDLDDL